MKTKTTLLFILFWTVLTNAQNLVAYYPFNGNTNDESGNLNHGTLYEAVLTTDRFANENSAYEFDGIDDYIQVVNSTSLNIFNSDLTITYWLYNDNPSLTDQTYKGVSKGGFDVGAGYELIYSNYWDNGNLHFTTSNSGNNMGSFNNYNNQWTMVTGTFDNTTNVKKMYVNGVEQTSTIQGVTGLISSTADLYIGRRNPANGYAGFVKGKIDDIRIYSSKLTDAEILNLYTNNSLSLSEVNNPNENNFYVFNKKVYFRDNFNLNDIQSIAVYDVLGQTIFQTTKIENQLQLDVLNNQIYILKVAHSNGSSQNLKFIAN